MIYVTGDMHGDLGRFSQRAIKKLKADDTLISLGDFGFLWLGDEQEEKNLSFIKDRKFKVLFVEGTHENYTLLEKYPVCDYCGGKVRDLGGNLKMLLRGEIYEIEGKKIFALGGGESEDAEFRLEGQSWWQQELPSAEELEYADENLKKCKNVDFIVTHSAPFKIKTSLFGRDINENRLDKFLDKVMMTVKYDKWYFGCYHIDRKLTRTHYAVYQNVLEITSPEKKGFFAKLFKKKKQ
ncbi:MAG: metallophosphoesterase [Ruminococcaceae bacterium]|nr:metallophosphoesterase [Oscillospiraceae bacterium]